MPHSKEHMSRIRRSGCTSGSCRSTLTRFTPISSCNIIFRPRLRHPTGRGARSLLRHFYRGRVILWDYEPLKPTISVLQPMVRHIGRMFADFFPNSWTPCTSSERNTSDSCLKPRLRSKRFRVMRVGKTEKIYYLPYPDITTFNWLERSNSTRHSVQSATSGSATTMRRLLRRSHYLVNCRSNGSRRNSMPI